MKRNRNDRFDYDYEDGLYFICNPWNCRQYFYTKTYETCFNYISILDDMVFMPEERLLEEYILSDVGKIWTGPVGSHRGREWIFGQFDACVLPAVWLMLESSELEHAR